MVQYKKTKGNSELKTLEKRTVIGILAHVDAGKTTLSEAMLYTCGALRKLGRVDHQNAFLDTETLERQRGITIFSKQAVFSYNDLELQLLDTPGHVDFSTEMERSLQVLDYAILVINGTDGVQSHTETLWRLLQRYQVPTFLFINKMDLQGAEREKILLQLKRLCSEGCVDFSTPQGYDAEEVSMCDEELMNAYLETGVLTADAIARAICNRTLFPCYFGAALKLEGVAAFLEGLERYTLVKEYSKQFGAKVYKISRDAQGTRLTWLKITGGSLKVKELLPSSNEKIDQIRIYSGAKYTAVQEVQAGMLCAVTGPVTTYPGQGLGMEPDTPLPELEPVLTYQVLFSEHTDMHDALQKLRQLEEEDPQLHIVWNPTLKEIHIQLMGEIQLEILKQVIFDRFGLRISFGSGNIVYKETIAASVEGVGHFEPLRHYAEVHLLLKPLPLGSGLQFDTACSENTLDLNWQRLILTHLQEKTHIGVLTGSPITDMKITLLTGKAHLKHTEGGDFRQATYRAVRQGLRQALAENAVMLLEPWYEFRLELPAECVGRAMTDVQQMQGTVSSPEITEDLAVLTGSAPAAAMQGYVSEVISYTRGKGRLSCRVKGYAPCHNTPEVIAKIGYDCDSDVENTADSVFCAHGAGFNVKWDQVTEYMHLQSPLRAGAEPTEVNVISPSPSKSYADYRAEDKELEAIFERTYGPVKRKRFLDAPEKGQPKEVSTPKPVKPQEPVEEYLLVDGYNIIFAWDDLTALAKENLDAARQVLMDILCNYQGFKKCHVIVVFDAYKVKGGIGSIEAYHNIDVVYTREAETADMYIEKFTYDIRKKKHLVRVATSDALEQLIVLGHGAFRVSARAFYEEMQQTNQEISKMLRELSGKPLHNPLPIPKA